MHLTINHRTRFRYKHRVALQPHRLVFTPRDSGDLTTIRKTLRIAPEPSITLTLDVFGNQVVTATFAEPTDTLTISNELVVDSKAESWPVFAIDVGAHRYPFNANNRRSVFVFGAFLPVFFLSALGVCT
jgi:transglutaminase-like putative cysteine protease